MTPLPIPTPRRRSAIRAVLVLAGLLALCAAVPPAQAAGTGVHAVMLDRLESVPTDAFRFVPCPDTGTFVPLDGGFRFEEQQPGTAGVGGTPYPGGYLAIGCGEAQVERTAPAGARHVEVLFQGDRVVDEFDVQGNALTRPGRAFEQQVHFRAPEAPHLDREVAYFDPASGPAGMQPVAPDAFALPANGSYALAWVFRDSSYFVGPDFPDVLSGQAFAATVQDVQVRYPGIPLAHDAHEHLQRQGTLVTGETQVRVDVTDPGAGDLRLVVDDGLAFRWLRGPDGQRVTEQASRLPADAEGEGSGRAAVVVEPLDDGRLQVTVPRELLASLGPGPYTLSFATLDAVRTFPWLLPLAFLVLLAPLPFALLAYRHVHRFEDEAFGGFRRSALNLRIALIVAFAYYAVVVASHFLGSRVELMTAWPMPVEAALLYVQVVIAVAAFLALFAVARELYRITVPRPIPAGSPRPPSAPLPEDPE